MSPTVARTAGQQQRADSAAMKKGTKGKAQGDAKEGSGDKLREMKLGTWNVQALGCGLLQMLLGMSCVDADGSEWRQQRAIPERLHLVVLGMVPGLKASFTLRPAEFRRSPARGRPFESPYYHVLVYVLSNRLR